MSTMTNRRSFLQQVAGVGAVVLMPSHFRRQREFPTREIPGTGERLPVVGFGSTKAVLQVPDRGIDPVASVLKKFVDLGGRVVDTSPRSVEIDREFGRALQQNMPEDLFVCAKINTMGRDAGIAQFRQSQTLFGRRSVDLVQVESLRDLDVHWPNLLAWKDRGEARYIGVTVSNYYGYEQLESFMRNAALDFVHVNYSVMETRAEERILPLAMDRGLAVLTNRPFLNGNYFAQVEGKPLPAWAGDFDCSSWAQFSVKYILAHTAVTVVFTETTNPLHMEENMNSAFGRLPDESTKRRMRELVQSF